MTRTHQAAKAYQLQSMLDDPSQSQWDSEEMVCGNMISCPISMEDVTNAYKIFGPNLADMSGKTSRRMSKCVEIDYVAILKDIYSIHKYVT